MGKSERVEGQESLHTAGGSVSYYNSANVHVYMCSVKSHETNFRFMFGEEGVPKQLKQYGAQDRTVCLLGVNFGAYLSYL